MNKKEEDVKNLKKPEPFAYKNWTDLIKPTKIDVDKEEKYAVVDVEIKEKINSPVTLKEIKANSFFEDFHLPKYGRLSVMPVSKEIWEKLIEMGEGTTLV